MVSAAPEGQGDVSVALVTEKRTVASCDVERCAEQIGVHDHVEFGVLVGVAMQHGWSFVSGKVRCPAHTRDAAAGGWRD